MQNAKLKIEKSETKVFISPFEFYLTFDGKSTADNGNIVVDNLTPFNASKMLVENLKTDSSLRYYTTIFNNEVILITEEEAKEFKLNDYSLIRDLRDVNGERISTRKNEMMNSPCSCEWFLKF